MYIVPTIFCISVFWLYEHENITFNLFVPLVETLPSCLEDCLKIWQRIENWAFSE